MEHTNRSDAESKMSCDSPGNDLTNISFLDIMTSSSQLHPLPDVNAAAKDMLTSMQVISSTQLPYLQLLSDFGVQITSICAGITNHRRKEVFHQTLMAPPTVAETSRSFVSGRLQFTQRSLWPFWRYVTSMLLRQPLMRLRVSVSASLDQTDEWIVDTSTGDTLHITISEYDLLSHTVQAAACSCYGELVNNDSMQAAEVHSSSSLNLLFRSFLAPGKTPFATTIFDNTCYNTCYNAAYSTSYNTCCNTAYNTCCNTAYNTSYDLYYAIYNLFITYALYNAPYNNPYNTFYNTSYNATAMSTSSTSSSSQCIRTLLSLPTHIATKLPAHLVTSHLTIENMTRFIDGAYDAIREISRLQHLPTTTTNNNHEHHRRLSELMMNTSGTFSLFYISLSLSYINEYIRYTLSCCIYHIGPSVP